MTGFILVRITCPSRRVAEDIADAVKRVHPYDVPAIVATALTHITDDYAAWALENTAN